MRKVTVRFFAVFREATGVESVEVETGAETVMGLFTEMAGRYDGLEHEPAALVAVNDEMSRWERSITDGDEVLFFPPVAGG
jgi:molybdopterin converting factor subunit 1